MPYPHCATTALATSSPLNRMEPTFASLAAQMQLPRSTLRSPGRSRYSVSPVGIRTVMPVSEHRPPKPYGRTSRTSRILSGARHFEQNRRRRTPPSADGVLLARAIRGKTLLYAMHPLPD